MHLNSSGIGGYLGTAFINHFCYDDDLCLINLSSSGMQQLLHICFESFFLGQSKIPMVEQCRYLGTTISIKNSDLDLKRQMRNMYVNANLLLRKFYKCSINL